MCRVNYSVLNIKPRSIKSDREIGDALVTIVAVILDLLKNYMKFHISKSSSKLLQTKKKAAREYISKYLVFVMIKSKF